MKRIFLYVLPLFISASSFSQEKKGIVDGAGDQVKIAFAKQKFYGGDVRSALNTYKELATTNPDDGTIAYHIAECHYALGDLAKARELLEKAGTMKNPHEENSLLLGRIYQGSGELDKALEQYTFYRKTVPSAAKLKETDIDFLIAQCNTAKEMMAKPVNVKINNMGNIINSEFNDKKPTLSIDGRRLIFTSGRPETKGGKVDLEGGGVYFDDIYLSEWDTINNTWGAPVPLKGSVNTSSHDACTSLSPDGKQLFIYLNSEDEGGAGDIYVSRASSSGKWSTPKKVQGVNSSYYEDAACLSPDGKKLYFVSERPKGGLGHGDIWVSERVSKNEWGEPVNLGPVVNTDRDENAIYLHPDGKTLFFSSEGHNSMGEHDLFKTVYEDGKWSTPVNLGYPINSLKQDKSFILAADNKTAFFVSNRDGGLGGDDIYMVDMSAYGAVIKKSSTDATASVKGKITAEGGQPVNAQITVMDQNGSVVATAKSNEGTYSVDVKASQEYIIKIEADGYNAREEKVAAGAETQDFILSKK